MLTSPIESACAYGEGARAATGDAVQMIATAATATVMTERRPQALPDVAGHRTAARKWDRVDTPLTMGPSVHPAGGAVRGAQGQGSVAADPVANVHAVCSTGLVR